MTTTIKSQETSITVISFSKTAPTIAEAAVLLREAIGRIKSLSDSLVGKNPLCAEALELNKREHADIRKFTTEEGLQEYKVYMTSLLERANENYDGSPATFGDFGKDGEGFDYATGSGRSNVQFCKSDLLGGWEIRGMAMFKNPDIARRNLIAKGFEVEVHQ